MGRSSGTGWPLTFRCAKCGDIHAARVTGKIRALGPGETSWRHDGERIKREYRCSCGHIGWSKHPDLARKYRQEGGDAA